MSGRPRFLAVVGCAAALAAACSSGHSPSAAATRGTSPTPSTATSTAARPVSGGITGRARAILLRLSDLPSGWRPTPPLSQAEQRQENVVFDRCLGVPLINTESTASATSQFKSSSGLQDATSAVWVTKTAAEAAVYQRALMTGRLVTCSQQDARTYAAPPAGGRVISVTAARLPVPNGLFGVRVIVRMRLRNGELVPLYVDNLGRFVNRFEVEVGFGGLLQPPSGKLEGLVAAKVFARAAREAG